MTRRKSRILLCSWTVAVCTSLWFPAAALETLSLGQDGAIGWDGSNSGFPTLDPEYRGLATNEILIGNTPGALIDFDHPNFPGSLVPRQLLEGENVAIGTIQRGGNIRSPTVLDFDDNFKAADLKIALEELLSTKDGGELLAFERKNLNALGTLIISDLGARFGVNRIRVYPRNTIQRSPTTPFQLDFMRAFELFVNDGLNLTRDGFPIWELLVENKDNTAPVIDVILDPPQYIQSIRLRSTTSVDFEVDEIEVFGTGFLPTARYLSDIFDLGLASWGNIRWNEQIIGDPRQTRLLISTRTGRDETPFVYTRKIANLSDAPEIPFSLNDPEQPMTREEYEDLPARDESGLDWEAGAVKEDLENWSPWSTPYPAAGNTPEGTPLLSPGPRRYIQFQVLALSQDLEAVRILDDISVEYLSPPLADQFVAEIFPLDVEASTVTSFTYAVRPSMETSGLLGFDAFEISTPLRIEGVDRIEIIDGQGAVVSGHTFASGDTLGGDGFGISSIEDTKFTVRFPLIQDSDRLLKVTFRASVLVYSTNFRGRASFSAESGAFQEAVPGDVTDLDPTDDPTRSGITVFSPSILKGQLIDGLKVTPNPLTPNGDGRNDLISISYNVLTLTKAGKVEIGIYDLSGKLIHILQKGEQRSGRYFHDWDGLDANGNRVLPGVYLLHLSVEGDNRQEARVRPLAVAY